MLLDNFLCELDIRKIKSKNVIFKLKYVLLHSKIKISSLIMVLIVLNNY